MIDEIAGQAKSNQGNRNDLTLASAEAEVKKGKTTKRLAEINLKKWCRHQMRPTPQLEELTKNLQN